MAGTFTLSGQILLFVSIFCIILVSAVVAESVNTEQLVRDVEQDSELVARQRASPLQDETTIQNDEPKCSVVSDVGFIIDCSTSMFNYYDKEKEFVNAIAASFEISEDATRLSVIKFSFWPSLAIKFNEYHNLEAFQNAVRQITIYGSHTSMDKALRLAQTEMFKPENGARADVSNKLVIMFTDGEQTKFPGYEDPALVVNDLREAGIRVLVVGMGARVKKASLMHIVGGEEYAFKADTFDMLEPSGPFLNSVLEKVCPSAGPTSTAPPTTQVVTTTTEAVTTTVSSTEAEEISTTLSSAPEELTTFTKSTPVTGNSTTMIANITVNTTQSKEVCKETSCKDGEKCLIIKNKVTCPCRDGYYRETNGTCLIMSFVFESEISLKQTFTPELNDPESDEFKNLAQNVESSLLTGLKAKIPDVAAISVTEFRSSAEDHAESRKREDTSGGVLVVYDIIMKPDFEAEDISPSELVTAVSDEIKAGHMSGINADASFTPTVKVLNRCLSRKTHTCIEYEEECVDNKKGGYTCKQRCKDVRGFYQGNVINQTIQATLLTWLDCAKSCRKNATCNGFNFQPDTKCCYVNGYGNGTLSNAIVPRANSYSGIILYTFVLMLSFIMI